MMMSFYIGQATILAKYMMQPGTGMHAMGSDDHAYMLMYLFTPIMLDNYT